MNLQRKSSMTHNITQSLPAKPGLPAGTPTFRAHALPRALSAASHELSLLKFFGFETQCVCETAESRVNQHELRPSSVGIAYCGSMPASYPLLALTHSCRAFYTGGIGANVTS